MVLIKNKGDYTWARAKREIRISCCRKSHCFTFQPLVIRSDESESFAYKIAKKQSQPHDCNSRKSASLNVIVGQLLLVGQLWSPAYITNKRVQYQIVPYIVLVYNIFVLVCSNFMHTLYTYYILWDTRISILCNTLQISSFSLKLGF
jgi:hypothetical protein